MTSDTQKPKKKLILNFLINGTPSLAFGEWRNPDDHSRTVNTLEYWVNLAKIAERGKIHGIFIADHLVYFNAYKDSWKPAISKAVFSPRIAPEAAVTAMASVTQSLGFGITFSTVSEHPYHFARRLASLDQLTGGRIGWNIVGSYLRDIGPQLLNGAPLPNHDDRYEKTQEFLDAVYDLLLASWRDDAVKYDKKNGVFADPELIRRIDHNGKFFSIEGPGITEPTPQRFPVIFQAGASKKGRLFSAENSEYVFLSLDKDQLKPTITDIRRIAKERFGRDPESLKFVISAAPVIGRTHEEAVEKVERYKKYLDEEAALVVFSGYSGIDADKFDWDEPVEAGNTQAGQTMSNMMSKKKGKTLTRRQIAETGNKLGALFGTSEEVANELEDLALNYGVDGFNFSIPVHPESANDLVDLLVPELQRRGLFHEDYDVPGGTFRENLTGKPDQSFFQEEHPAFPLRWDPSLTKEEFEAKIAEYKAFRSDRRVRAEQAENPR